MDDYELYSQNLTLFVREVLKIWLHMWSHNLDLKFVRLSAGASESILT